MQSCKAIRSLHMYVQCTQQRWNRVAGSRVSNLGPGRVTGQRPDLAFWPGFLFNVVKNFRQLQSVSFIILMRYRGHWHVSHKTSSLNFCTEMETGLRVTAQQVTGSAIWFRVGSCLGSVSLTWFHVWYPVSVRHFFKSKWYWCIMTLWQNGWIIDKTRKQILLQFKTLISLLNDRC